MSSIARGLKIFIYDQLHQTQLIINILMKIRKAAIPAGIIL